MRWLITTSAGCDLDILRKRLSECRADLPEKPKATPLENGEQVYAVEGPVDLSRSAVGIPGVVRINPASKPELIGH